MKLNTSQRCWVLFGTLIVSTSMAEEYNFEVGLDFDSMSFDGSESILEPGGTIFSLNGLDTDMSRVFADWYFVGLSDDNGPRARAEFVDRASSFSIAYTYSDQSGTLFRRSDDPATPLPPLDQALNDSGQAFAADFRYVDRESGWFGEAGIVSSETLLGGIALDSISRGDGWNIGVGKYVFETTSLSVNLGEVDNESVLDGSFVGLDFSHLGDLGERWQYATDLGYSRLDSDFGPDVDTWNATVALYPTRDFEFGFSAEDVSAGSGQFFDLDRTSFEGFASWFVTPNVRLSARYRVDDVGFESSVITGAPMVTDTDQDSFGISATVRF